MNFCKLFFLMGAILIIYVPEASAQQHHHNYAWGNILQNPDQNVTITAHAIDGDGSVYSFGGLWEGPSVDIDPGLGTFLVNHADGPNFIQKLDENGAFIWGGQFGIAPNGLRGMGGRVSISDVITDINDNVYIAYIQMPGLEGPTPFNANLLEGNTDTLFFPTPGAGCIVKMDKNGALLWSVSFPDAFPPGILSDGPDFSMFSINKIVTDDQENLYVAGHFVGDSADFDPDTGTYSISSARSGSGYLLKLNKEGLFQWVVGIDGGTPRIDFFLQQQEEIEISVNNNIVNDIVLDDVGNILLVGRLELPDSSKIDLDPGTGSEDTFFVSIQNVQNTTNGNTAPFLMKINNSGNFEWAKLQLDSVSPFTSRPFFDNIFINNQNELFITGRINGTADLDLDTGKFYLTEVGKNFDGTYSDFFFLKLNADGTFNRVQRLYSEFGRFSLQVRQGGSGKFYITSSYIIDGSSVDYNPGESVHQLKGGLPFISDDSPLSYLLSFQDPDSIPFSNTSITSYQISCLDEEGRFQWIKGLETKNMPLIFPSYNMQVDKSDNLFFSGSAISPENTTGYIDANPFYSDTAKLSFVSNNWPNNMRVGTGGFLFKWGNIDCNANSSTYDTIELLTCESSYCGPSGKLYTSSGTYSDTSANSKGCDSILTIYLTMQSPSELNIDTTLCSGTFNNPWTGEQLDRSGFYRYQIDTKDGCYQYINLTLRLLGVRTHVDVTACDSYTSSTGQIWDSSGTYQEVLTNANGCDSILMVHLEVLKSNTVDQATITSCGSLTSANGKYIWTESGTYLDTLVNANGCDSIVLINLTILPLNKEININNTSGINFLTAQEERAEYQWVNCEENYKVIEQEDQQEYSFGGTGSYAVILNAFNGCIDTSECITIYPTSINSIKRADNLYIYPNPSYHNLTITTPTINWDYIEIRDMSGRILLQKKVSKEKTVQIDVHHLSSGNYWLFVQTKQGKLYTSFIKH